MDWFAMSSKFYLDLDDQGVSEAGQTLLMRICGYIADNETSGHIAKSALKKLGLTRLSRRIDELIREGLMIETADGLGYDIPAWPKWNGPLERLVNKRKADRERIAEKRSKDQNVARHSREKDAMSHDHIDSNKNKEGTYIPSPPPVRNADAGAKRSRGLAIADELNETARPAAVYTFMHDYEQSRSSPVDQRTLAGIENAITPLIAAKIPEAQIAAGLRLWESSDSFSPTQIAAYVHKAGSPKATPKSTTDERVRAAQALKTGSADRTGLFAFPERKEIQA